MRVCVHVCVCVCVHMCMCVHIFVKGEPGLLMACKSHMTQFCLLIPYPFLHSPHLLLIPIPFYPPFLSSSSLLFVERADTHHSGDYGMGAHIFQTYLFA